MAIRSVLLGLLFLLVQRTPAPPRSEPYRDPDAYAVYSAALSQAQPDRRKTILGETVTYPRCFPKGEALSDESWGEAAQDYLVENKTPRTLVRSFELKDPYVLLPLKEWESLFQKSDWRPFWKRYGERSGYSRLSAVGFDRSRTKAILYRDFACGHECGEGGYKLFTKFGGRWRSTIVKADLCDWVSQSQTIRLAPSVR